MNLAKALGALEKEGTAQNRKVYARHGVGPTMFGVSYAVQKRLAKEIGVDQKLAEELWATGNHDARILATYIADKKSITAGTLHAWAKELDNYVISDAVSGLAGAVPKPLPIMRKWIRSSNEWISRAGWQVLARLAMDYPEIGEDELRAALATIERDIHAKQNFTRHAMNMALIAIGLRNPVLQKHALRAAKEIGKVEVDHGETGCKTPDATEYIRKTAAYRKTKSVTRKTK